VTERKIYSEAKRKIEEAKDSVKHREASTKHTRERKINSVCERERSKCETKRETLLNRGRNSHIQIERDGEKREWDKAKDRHTQQQTVRKRTYNPKGS
jgi:hypothetical protein